MPTYAGIILQARCPPSHRHRRPLHFALDSNGERSFHRLRFAGGESEISRRKLNVELRVLVVSIVRLALPSAVGLAHDVGWRDRVR
jgi:hypothetical protein